MVDRRSLRKQNQRLNQSEPILPEPQKGSIGDRNRDTGKYATNLDNDGTYQVDKIFDASVGAGTQVQINEGTVTADYISAPKADQEFAGGIDESQRLIGVGIPYPEDIEEDGNADGEHDDPTNPYFGNCGYSYLQ